ncbi:16S rRNA (cytosine(1402)-N(4))-methyltransferase [Bacillus sp. V5-8f]|nr:16S rRNA (cytosine(1402)-N(4))-methyltransferase [Bacillus sp. V5-8f]
MSKFGVSGAHPGGLTLTKEIFKTENIDQTSYILDVGCGTGQTAAYLAAQYGAKVIGLDNNPTMIAKAKNRMAKYQLPVQIIHGSIEEFPMKSNTFDFIISESVLSFINKPKSLKEIFRLLKRNGRFIANELTINYRLNPANEDEIKRFYGIDSLHMEKDWISLFEQTGFTNIKTRSPAQAMHQNNEVPEFVYSNNIAPELYTVFQQHFYIMTMYQGFLDYRIYSCTK